jgi:hypothetical protein
MKAIVETGDGAGVHIDPAWVMPSAAFEGRITVFTLPIGCTVLADNGTNDWWVLPFHGNHSEPAHSWLK